MAIYHFSGTVISRSQGRTAIAAAAYRSGEKLHDEKQNLTFDYSRKHDVLHKEILLPVNAPAWMGNREKLWNAVEKTENRKDSQIAREVQFTLPRELSKTQNIELTREFIQTHFVDRGMAADLCIHSGKTKDGEEQPHAHVMLTMREITEDGFGLKERKWNDKDNYMLWREAWAEHANKYLALNGIDQRIDHRSYAEQGIDLTPQTKIGSKNLKDHERRVEEHRLIAQENGEKIFNDPSIALDAITRQQSTFTHNDLARFVNRHTVDAKQFQLVYEKLKSSEHIVYLGLDEKNKEKFTTKEVLATEKQMLASVAKLQNLGHEIATTLSSKNDDIAAANRPTTAINLSEQQQNALEHITNPGDIKCLVGYAGTGKSRLLGEAREVWEANGYQVQGATLAGIAAENLEGSSGIASKTVASMFYQWDAGKNLTKKDILIIDEAGMLGTNQLAKIVIEVNNRGAKLVLIGDPQQLQAIEAGGAFRAISATIGYTELTEVRRQQEDWQKQATKEFAIGDVAAAIKRYDNHDHVHKFDTQASAKTAMVEMWNDVRVSVPDQTQIILAYTTKDVQELNEIARDFRKQNNELGQDCLLTTATGNKAFAEGDRIYFLRNNRDLGVMNGTLGTIERITGTGISVLSDKNDHNGNKRQVNFNLNDYNYITHGYAATIHKAQGVTVDRSYILASKYLDSHAAYVGMTRHCLSADLFYSKEEFNNEQSLLYTLGRDRSKDLSLDYFHGEIGRYTLDGALLEPNQAYDNEPGYTLAPEYHELDTVAQETAPQKLYEEAKLQQEPELTLKSNISAKDELAAFQAQFERNNPELAAAIAKEIGTVKSLQDLRTERLIEEYHDLKNSYQKQMTEDGLISDRIETKEQITKCMHKIYKDNDTMEYLKENNQELYNEIHSSMQRDRAFEMQKELDLTL